MPKIAVIKTGGKQYKIAEGDQVNVERLKIKDSVSAKTRADKGEKATFDQVLLIADSKSGESKIGTPLCSGARVEAKVLEQGRAKKVKVVKYKSKTRYKKVYGHRQPYTKVEIIKIIY